MMVSLIVSIVVAVGIAFRHHYISSQLRLRASTSATASSRMCDMGG